MLIHKTFKFRIYPTDEQQHALDIQFGHVRFVYNYFLDLRTKIYEETGKSLYYREIQDLLTQMKKNPDFIWLKEADSQAFQVSIQDLQKAFENWFRMCKEGTLPSNKGKKPRKDGKPRGYPSFKSKHDPQSIRYPQRFKVEDGKMYLPKVGWVKLIQYRDIEGEMKNCTVSKTKTGKYFVSIQCELETPDPEPRMDDPAVGIDMGLKDFITTSDGEKVKPPKYLRSAERRLKIRQRRSSRKTKGSKNREKARQRLALQHEKIANQRRDFHHKLSRELVDKYGHLGFEDLNIEGMLKNHNLAKSIQDAGWAQFIGFCEYKQEWMGGTIAKSDRWFPSSKACSDCGSIKHNLQLSDREWICLDCGSLHDRDKNAAKNILSATMAGTAKSHACQI